MILSCLTANHFSDGQRVVGLQGSNKRACWLSQHRNAGEQHSQPAPRPKWKEGSPGLKPRLPCLRDAFTVGCPGTAAPQTQKCSSASAFHMQDRQEAIIKATVWIKTGERKDEMENFFTFSIFCSQPLQVLLLDLAYSAAKSFRLFSALPPPSCSPPFPGEQSKYRVQL